ncbi:MAG: putative toxin-antitoxin system toxin component, PIN family [Planctomycetaceae bacterium]
MLLGASYRTPPIVMDTNVLVAGACRHTGSAAYQVLLHVLHRRIPLLMTEAIALEYVEVLQRPTVRAVTGLSHQQSADLVNDLIAISLEVQLNFAWRPNLADESDNKFVEAAIHAGATIVTYNERDYQAADLQQHGWSVMNPREFAVRYFG